VHTRQKLSLLPSSGDTRKLLYQQLYDAITRINKFSFLKTGGDAIRRWISGSRPTHSRNSWHRITFMSNFLYLLYIGFIFVRLLNKFDLCAEHEDLNIITARNLTTIICYFTCHIPDVGGCLTKSGTAF
jgi:hypothetical protein